MTKLDFVNDYEINFKSAKRAACFGFGASLWRTYSSANL